MREFKTELKSSFILLLSIAFLFLTSCGKDEEEDPNYVGSWYILGTMTTSEGNLQLKKTVIFTKNTYTDLIQLLDDTSHEWTDYMKMECSLSVVEHSMSITLKEYGFSTLDMVTGDLTGIIASYKAGTTKFDNLVEEMEQPTSWESEYIISGKNIIIMTDENNDGDFTDPNETISYAEQ